MAEDPRVLGEAFVDPLREDASRIERMRALDRKSRGRHGIVYATLAAFAVIFFGAVGLYWSGLLSHAPSTTTIPWDLTLVILAFLLTAGLGTLIAAKAAERRSHTFITRDAAEITREIRLMSAGVALAVVLTAVAFLTWFQAIPWLDAKPWGWKVPSEAAAFALVSGFAPYGFIEFRRHRRTRLLEERFPDFLRDLTEAQTAGMTMAMAVRSVSNGDYGMLTPEVQRLAQQVSWGVSFQEAFALFGERVGTKLVARTTTLVNKATNAGGDMRDVLAAAARDARELKVLESERRTTMGMYVIVMYVSYFVFLAVTLVLAGIFIPAMLQATASVSGGSIGGVRVEKLPRATFHFIYFSAAIVQGIGSGLVAGVMSEGSFPAGVKHASILTGIAALVFVFV